MRLSDFVISKMMQQPDRPQLNQFIKDDVTPSLHLKVGLNVASWHFIGTVKGIRVRQALGKHPTITTEEVGGFLLSESVRDFSIFHDCISGVP